MQTFRTRLDVCDAWEARGRADATRAALLGFTAGRVPEHRPAAPHRAAAALARRGGRPRQPPVFAAAQGPGPLPAVLPDRADDLLYVWPPAAFPRWPVRRARPKAVTAEAAAGCGLVVLDRVSGIADLGLPVLALG